MSPLLASRGPKSPQRAKVSYKQGSVWWASALATAENLHLTETKGEVAQVRLRNRAPGKRGEGEQANAGQILRLLRGGRVCKQSRRVGVLVQPSPGRQRFQSMKERSYRQRGHYKRVFSKGREIREQGPASPICPSAGRGTLKKKKKKKKKRKKKNKSRFATKGELPRFIDPMMEKNAGSRDGIGNRPQSVVRFRFEAKMGGDPRIGIPTWV